MPSARRASGASPPAAPAPDPARSVVTARRRLDAGEAGAPVGPLALRLLHVVLAEDAVAGFQHRHDALGRLFFEAFEEALMYDFAMEDGAEAASSFTHVALP